MQQRLDSPFTPYLDPGEDEATRRRTLCYASRRLWMIGGVHSGYAFLRGGVRPSLDARGILFRRSAHVRYCSAALFPYSLRPRLVRCFPSSISVSKFSVWHGIGNGVALRP